MIRITLKPDRDKPIRNRHPWIFSGAIADMETTPEAGDIVSIHAANGDWLACAGYSPESQIRARVWSWVPDQHIDARFFRRQITSSYQRRQTLYARTNAYRVVNAEADLLPGLIVDRYGDFAVVQFLTAGIERWKDVIAQAVMDILEVEGVYERSDVDVRKKEGLASSVGLMCGAMPPKEIEIWERFATGQHLHYKVDVYNGHKTGFYMDQRDNRAVVKALAEDRVVLNTYSYSGAFAVASYAGAAKQVINVDSSQPALDLAESAIQHNWFPVDKDNFVVGDVPTLLRTYRREERQFDMIILDPPKFVHNKGQLDRATRAYKDINMQAMHLLRQGGILVTFSCSGLMSEDLFQKILFGAAVDAQKDIQIVQRLGQATDHPTLLAFPESQYLKGFVLYVCN